MTRVEDRVYRTQGDLGPGGGISSGERGLWAGCHRGAVERIFSPDMYTPQKKEKDDLATYFPKITLCKWFSLEASSSRITMASLERVSDVSSYRKTSVHAYDGLPLPPSPLADDSQIVLHDRKSVVGSAPIVERGRYGIPDMGGSSASLFKS